MDKSEKYIAMCDHPLIQDIQPECCVVNSISGIATSVDCGEGCNFWAYVDYQDELVWLPRQDQLQEMLPDYGTLAQAWFPVIGLAFNRDPIYYYEFKTAEQAILAFVMKELHNMTWEGGEWKPTVK